MLQNKQSIEQKSSQITENVNEVRSKITDSSFRISETCGPDDRNYEMRHYRGSMLRWQENGGVLLIARSADLTPNEGYLDVKSTGYMHFKSDHDIQLTAEGHKVTGGCLSNPEGHLIAYRGLSQNLEKPTLVDSSVNEPKKLSFHSVFKKTKLKGGIHICRAGKVEDR